MATDLGFASMSEERRLKSGFRTMSEANLKWIIETYKDNPVGKLAKEVLEERNGNTAD